MTKNAREFSREFYKNSPRISVGLGGSQRRAMQIPSITHLVKSRSQIERHPENFTMDGMTLSTNTERVSDVLHRRLAKTKWLSG